MPPKINCRLVLMHLDVRSFTFTWRPQVPPPLEHNLAESALRRHKPTFESFLRHQIVCRSRLDIIRRILRDWSVTIRRRIHYAHPKSRRIEFLTSMKFPDKLDLRPSLLKLFGSSTIHKLPLVSSRRVPCQNLLFVQDVEKTGVVILVHGLAPLPAFAPRQCMKFGITGQSPYYPRHQNPPHL